MKILTSEGLYVLLSEMLTFIEESYTESPLANTTIDGTIALVSGTSGSYSLRKNCVGTVTFSGNFSTTFSVPGGTKIASLPENFRPSTNLTFPSTAVWEDNSAGAVKLEISKNGDILVTGYETWSTVKNVRLRNLYVGCSFNL